MTLYTDSDWAGCRRTRKSTSGGAILLGNHCVKCWSSTQGPIALSSAEAEYYSMVEGVTRAIGLKNLAAEVGVVFGATPIILYTDSTAAKSFASRRGLGKMRHIETRELWLQESVNKKDVLLKKVQGEDNPADLMTKYLQAKDITKHVRSLGIELLV